MSTFAIAITIIFIIIGIIGTIIPVLPGTAIAGLAVLIFAWVDGFQLIGGGAVVWIILITLVAGTSDLWMPLFGAKVGGASMKTVLYGLVGSIIGFFAGSIIPLLGNLIGSLVGYILGLLIAEYRKYQDWDRAFKAGLGGLTGWILSTAVQLVGAVIIFIIFVTQVF